MMMAADPKLEDEKSLLTELIEEYNTTAGMERLRIKLGQAIASVQDNVLKSLLKKHGYDVDATAEELSSTVLQKSS